MVFDQQIDFIEQCHRVILVVVQRATLVALRLQWSEVGDVWRNATVRIALFAPVNLTQSLCRRA